ncbi:MAG: FAD-dependent oxidoreductase [Clostridia bacterium]
MKYDVAVIGGGPAGMAAALSAKKQNANVIIIERDNSLGGILNQCIHNGFGLHYFKEELTGPEYAQRFIDEIKGENIDIMLNSFVLNINADKKLFVVSADRGVVEIEAQAIVLAMGCRERTAGAIGIPGLRPSGIWTAGMAQRLCNIEGKMIGRNIVILGSGDIGLIMARRMTFEGAKVKMVCELMPYSGGLKRNIVQCLNDFDIPLYFSTTITKVVGDKRVEGVFIATVDEKRKVKKETERFVECDTLLLSVGLLPENDLVNDIGMEMSAITGGAIVDEYRQTSINGIFSCGNVLHVHDLVDNVSEEALIAGENAGKYVIGDTNEIKRQLKVIAGKGVRYVLPQIINGANGDVKLFFRTDNIYKAPKAVVRCGDKQIAYRKSMIMTPGEMESFIIKKEDINEDIIVELM